MRDYPLLWQMSSNENLKIMGQSWNWPLQGENKVFSSNCFSSELRAKSGLEMKDTADWHDFNSVVKNS